MNILITGAQSFLGQAIITELMPKHRLRLWGSGTSVGENIEWITGDMRDPDLAWSVVRGIDVIVHTGAPPEDLPEDALAKEQMVLDFATRGTHVLFKAGIEAGVKRFVYGSTLEIFASYPDDVYISEMWKPRPVPEMFSLARYLGELTAREFAREYLVAVTALRFGKLVTEEEVVHQTPDLMWLDVRDAARAVHLSIHREASLEPNFRRRWALHHICANIPNGKYLVASGGWNALSGFAPEHNFERGNTA